MEKIMEVVFGLFIIGATLVFLSHNIQRAKQKFVYDFDDWFSISIICLVAFACGAMLIFGG